MPPLVWSRKNVLDILRAVHSLKTKQQEGGAAEEALAAYYNGFQAALEYLMTAFQFPMSLLARKNERLEKGVDPTRCLHFDEITSILKATYQQAIADPRFSRQPKKFREGLEQAFAVVRERFFLH